MLTIRVRSLNSVDCPRMMDSLIYFFDSNEHCLSWRVPYWIGQMQNLWLATSGPLRWYLTSQRMYQATVPLRVSPSLHSVGCLRMTSSLIYFLDLSWWTPYWIWQILREWLSVKNDLKTTTVNFGKCNSLFMISFLWHYKVWLCKKKNLLYSIVVVMKVMQWRYKVWLCSKGGGGLGPCPPSPQKKINFFLIV